MRKILTVQEVAVITGLAVQTLYNLRSQGGGPVGFSLRGRLRYYEDDVATWVEHQAERSLR
ncbi:helix-turn-helix domain-containing protein [Microbacterium maritypicum]|uniref:helix-turn-helix transcriptional regulator n=1 Tax=Microbacterium maritypicum TaxID=33918 RepID=UPI003ECEB583